MLDSGNAKLSFSLSRRGRVRGLGHLYRVPTLLDKLTWTRYPPDRVPSCTPPPSPTGRPGQPSPPPTPSPVNGQVPVKTLPSLVHMWSAKSLATTGTIQWAIYSTSFCKELRMNTVNVRLPQKRTYFSLKSLISQSSRFSSEIQRSVTLGSFCLGDSGRLRLRRPVLIGV